MSGISTFMSTLVIVSSLNAHMRTHCMFMIVVYADSGNFLESECHYSQEVIHALQRKDVDNILRNFKINNI